MFFICSYRKFLNYLFFLFCLHISKIKLHPIAHCGGQAGVSAVLGWWGWHEQIEYRLWNKKLKVSFQEKISFHK